MRRRQWKNPAGYKISGFNIEETRGGEYLLSGNRAVFYLDTSGAPKWQKTYSYMLEGTGREVANVFRCKLLRDNTPIIVGQIYEADCWTKYKRFYYDAWFSTIRYEDGLNSDVWTTTAGLWMGSDVIYDCAQMDNGNLVFAGSPPYVGGDKLLWLFVTDSTGDTVLWKKTFHGPEKDASIRPNSIVATPDSGFTVVGVSAAPGSNMNALAMHFVPKPVVSITQKKKQTNKHHQLKISVNGSLVTFTSGTHIKGEVSIYDMTGKQVARIKRGPGERTFTWDCSGVSNGVYGYRWGSGNGAVVGKMIRN